MSDQGISEQPSNGPKCIEIPRGWSRILENGSILYISPNNSRLRSLENVIEYLKTDGTCKCGLECPLFIHKVFNFDARIPSKLIPVHSRAELSQSGCKHCVIDSNNPQQPSEVAGNQASDAKLSGFSAVAPKRGPGRPRNPLSKSRRVAVRKHDLDRSTSPLHNIPLPVPSSIANSPVQSVPANIAVEQGPLPSFATIVSSSKLFNPGAALGNTKLSSSTVTSGISSSPIAAVSLLPSKTATTTANVSSAPSHSVTATTSAVTTLATMGQSVVEVTKTAVPVSTTVVVTHQQTAVAAALQPTGSQTENTLPKSTRSSTFGVANTPATTSPSNSKEPSRLASSSVTSVVSTNTKTISTDTQGVKSVANISKLPDVKATPKVSAARTSKATKSYGPRKTVAATLKAAAAAKASNISADAAKTSVSNPIQQTYQATSTADASAPSSEKKLAASNASRSQAISTPSVTTTVQAPALFHSVLKDAIMNEQGGAIASTLPSTSATVKSIISTTNAAPNHSLRGSQSAISASSCSKPTGIKETTQVTTALLHGVQVSHLPPSVSQQVQGHKAQPQMPGYPISSGAFGSQAPLVTTSQQQNVAAATVAQSSAQTSAPVSIYGQAQNTAGSSQMPSLQITASQAQGGVFFQGNGNQVFQMNVDSSQLKGAYQLHGALYQGAIPATFLATANMNKAAPSNAPGGIPHTMYPTNPYMLGIVMPAALTQSMPNQPGQSVPTTATSPSATAAAAAAVAAAAPVASYSYNNQNAAIAAAFESFVPIAPAASPRFSQTLAHLASAYTPFLPRGAVQGNAPVQFAAAQRMVSMGTMHPQSGGNGQMGQTVLNLGDYTVKYPLNTAKPGSYGGQSPTVTSVSQANTHQQQTAVVAAMPYVAFGQVNHPRFPFSVNFAAPSASTTPSVTSSSPSPACSFVTSATTTPHQHGAGNNSDSHALLGYVAMPFSTNSGSTTHSLSAPTPRSGSAFSPPSSHSATSHSSQRMNVLGPAPHLPTWCGAKSLTGATNQRRCSTPESTSSGACSVANSSTFSVPSSRSSCMEVSTSSVTAPKTPSFSQSPRHPGVTSPLNSPLTMLPPNQGLSACRGSPKGDSPLSSGRSNAESVPSRCQSLSANENHPAKTSSDASCVLKRTSYGDSSDQSKKAKYDESAYYEAYPLLGLKRSCEAIEAYCSPERDDDDDEEDNEIGDPTVSKNDSPSPVNHQSGEGNVNSKKCSNLNNGNGSRGLAKSDDEPVSDKRHSHSVYNGDVSANQKERSREQRVQMVTENAFSNVKTNPLSSNTPDSQECLREPSVPITRPQFDIGDIVWAQARGLPSWPGKVVDASEVGKGRPDDGKRWVMWFGDHTFSQVEVDRLKTLSEGLRTLDDKARKKKYKAKKARIELEQAISEALEALEVRERLRGRQASRSKAKKKRLR